MSDVRLNPFTDADVTMMLHDLDALVRALHPDDPTFSKVVHNHHACIRLRDWIARLNASPSVITCARCGKTTSDPDKWDPEADTGIIYCDACWPHRHESVHPLSKGTRVHVLWHNSAGQARIADGVVAGYEYRGDPEVWVLADGFERRIPLRSITSLEVTQ